MRGRNKSGAATAFFFKWNFGDFASCKPLRKALYRVFGLRLKNKEPEPEPFCKIRGVLALSRFGILRELDTSVV